MQPKLPDAAIPTLEQYLRSRTLVGCRGHGMIRPRRTPRRDADAPLSIMDAVVDLFPQWFRNPETWVAWFAFF